MTHFKDLANAYPSLSDCIRDITMAYERIKQTYHDNCRVYVCGNGGSEADARHITGELMKGFEKKRPATFDEAIRRKMDVSTALLLEQKLQGALPCHSLCSESALISALVNDIDADIIFAQQIYGYGRTGDSLICISTSGNATNVCLAAELAGAMGLHTIALTGSSGGKLAGLCDVSIKVPAESTAQVQEYHLPIYHALCRAVEDYFFAE